MVKLLLQLRAQSPYIVLVAVFPISCVTCVVSNALDEHVSAEFMMVLILRV